MVLASNGRAGYAIVPVRPTGAALHSAQLRYRALPGTRPRDRNVVVVNDAKGSFTNGHPIVRSSRGGRRPLASAMRFGCSSSEGGRRRASSVVTTFQLPPYDHAARATLGRRDAIGVRRPRRPDLREVSTDQRRGTESGSHKRAAELGFQIALLVRCHTTYDDGGMSPPSSSMARNSPTISRSQKPFAVSSLSTATASSTDMAAR